MNQVSTKNEPSGKKRARISGELLVGTWKFASDRNETQSSSRPNIEYFGSRPNGTFMFAANGRYAVILTHPDLPKFAANDRLKGTSEENAAVIRGVYAHFGTFSVDEGNSTFTMHIEGSSFPNDRETDTVRQITLLTDDELRFTNDAPPTGDVGTRAYINMVRVK
jgi:hypothetical protein